MTTRNVKCEIIKHIGNLKNGKYTKEINFVSWNGKKPVYDIRNYNVDGNGIKTALKGISLNFEEIRILKDILNSTELEQAKQGLDNLEFELALTGKDMKDLQKQPLINAKGFTYGSVEAKNGKAIILINLPRFVCGNNIMPYSNFESIGLEIIRNDCIEHLGRIFNNCLNTQVNKIEVNITQQVSGNATVNDVLNVLCHATLSSEFDNVKYVGKNKQDLESFKEESHSVITRKPH